MEETLLGIEDNLLGVNDEFINGVAEKTGTSPATTRKIAMHVRKKVFGFNAVATKAQKFMVMKASELDADTQKTLKSGKAKFRDADYYVRQIIVGNTEIIKPADVISKGKRNIDKAKLEPSVNLVVTKIRLAYGTDVAITNPGLIGYKNTDLALPAYFANGEIEIVVEGETILKKTPVSRFFGSGADATDNTVQGYRDCVELQSLKIIKSQKVIEIKFHVPEEASQPANNHFLEVRLIGEELYQN